MSALSHSRYARIVKLAADRTTREQRAALKAGDVERVYRLSEAVANERPRTIAHLGTGADATAYLTSGGGFRDPSVVKLLVDARVTPDVYQLGSEQAGLAKLVPEFAKIMPASTGSPYVRLNKHVAALRQEWAPHEVPGFRAYRVAMQRDGRDYDIPPTGDASIDALVKERDVIRDLINDSAGRPGQAALFEKRKRDFDALAKQLNTKFEETRNNPTKQTAEVLDIAGRASKAGVWDVDSHTGNVRTSRYGDVRVIDARIGGSRQQTAPADYRRLRASDMFPDVLRGDVSRVKTEVGLSPYLRDAYRQLAGEMPAVGNKSIGKPRILAQDHAVAAAAPPPPPPLSPPSPPAAHADDAVRRVINHDLPRDVSAPKEPMRPVPRVVMPSAPSRAPDIFKHVPAPDIKPPRNLWPTVLGSAAIGAPVALGVLAERAARARRNRLLAGGLAAAGVLGAGAYHLSRQVKD